MSAAAMDPPDHARALKIRAAIARGACIYQHGQGVLSISVEGEAGMLIVNADEMRRVIPGWPLSLVGECSTEVGGEYSPLCCGSGFVMG